MSAEIRTGFMVGNAAAQNVLLGFVPDYVMVVDQTDRAKITEWARGQHMVFTSGGTKVIAAGDTIKGATSGATTKVGLVMLTSGSWAGGDAAGTIFFDKADKVGTFETENIYVSSDSTAGTNDATIVVDVEYCWSTDTEVAGETTDAMITAYVGTTGGNPKGFTIGSTISTSDKTLFYMAIRGGQGDGFNADAGNALS
ncbi:MAG: hypothetical protein Q7S17_07755 [Xanthobacteraceae bacterium]|nr:hypothetical protein [Xanthobacteraceae bacterium]